MQFLMIRIAALLASALLSVGPAGAQTGVIGPYRAHPVAPETEHPALTEFSLHERAAIYAAVMKQKSTPLPFDMQIRIGMKLPESAEPQPLPDAVRANISAATKYQFTIWRDDVLLIDPAKKTVADILYGYVLRDYK